MEANLLGVFDERDAERRRETIRRTYATDVVWTDAEEQVVGHDRLHAKAQALLDGPLAGAHFAKSGEVRQVGNMGYLAFDVIPDGADTPVASGFDVAIVEGGLIAKLYTVLT
ncbi:nuclear transport factor 2 family protein [Mycolicibacterium sp. S2-37]|nr:nuclear transport factor 2 family protein [Mycolicibacterium sp. S2-37]